MEETTRKRSQPRRWRNRDRSRFAAYGPAPTIRLRLTLTYGVVFLITGAVLLTIGYALVRHNVSSPGRFRAELQRLGLAPPSAPFFGHTLGFTPGSPEVSVATAVRAQLLSDALHRLVVEYLFALGVMTMVSVGAGWLLAGRALRPLRDITATARRVSGQNLGERIALSGPADELKELADTFDGMLGRLDSAFASQRHFVANASHELRTPLAIMRTEVDVALADPDAGKRDLRAMGEAVRETVDRCERLIESLLTLARSEAAATRGNQVDLSALAGDCITDMRARAAQADVEIRADLAPAVTAGDERLFERLIANLLDNAIRYNEPGGFVVIHTRSERGVDPAHGVQRRCGHRPRRGGRADRALPATGPLGRRVRSRALDRTLGGRGARWPSRGQGAPRRRPGGARRAAGGSVGIA